MAITSTEVLTRTVKALRKAGEKIEGVKVVNGEMIIEFVKPKIYPDQMRIQQAMEYLGYSRTYMYDLFERGELHPIMRGRRVYLNRAELDDYLRQGKPRDRQEKKTGRKTARGSK